MPKLTPMQQRFVAEYIVDLNGTQAAIRAGFSAKNASSLSYQLLQKPPVQAAITAKVAENVKTIDMSADRVLRGLFDEATFTGEGSSHGARVAAWTALGRYHSLFVDKAEITVHHHYHDMTDEELDRELENQFLSAKSQGAQAH